MKGADHQNLRKLWLDTTPTEPSMATWNRVLEKIDEQRRRPVPTSRRGWLTASLIAASVAVVFGTTFGALHYSSWFQRIVRATRLRLRRRWSNELE